MPWSQIANIKGGIGLPGINAFTFTAYSFTIPDLGETVEVEVEDASWVAIGQSLYIEEAGTFEVLAKDDNELTLRRSVPPGVIVVVVPPPQNS